MVTNQLNYKIPFIISMAKDKDANMPS